MLSQTSTCTNCAFSTKIQWKEQKQQQQSFYLSVWGYLALLLLWHTTYNVHVPAKEIMWKYRHTCTCKKDKKCLHFSWLTSIQDNQPLSIHLSQTHLWHTSYFHISSQHSLDPPEPKPARCTYMHMTSTLHCQTCLKCTQVHIQ